MPEVFFDPGLNKQILNDPYLVPKPGAFFRLTAFWRIKPSFFIAGVQKGGTTALCVYMTAHPQVIPPQRKDVFYFNNTSNYTKGEQWYRSHFALKAYKWLYDQRYKTDAITFDGTPNYFDAADAATRIHKDYPLAKIILLLRNPIDRAWSNYQMARRVGIEKLSFEQALSIEDERLTHEESGISAKGDHNYVAQRIGYRKRGIYINYISNWVNLFPADKLLIVKSEDLFTESKKTYQRITDFLGLKRHELSAFQAVNDGAYQEKINPITRKQLQDFYKPYNEQLYTLLDTNYGWE